MADSEDSGYGLSDVGELKATDAPEYDYLPRMPKGYRPKVGVVGCGGISEYHLKAYKALGLEVAALCDVNAAAAAARRDAFYPEAEIYTDYRDLIARDDIEVVDATTHPPERVAIIEGALENGKHVLSQKPFVMDLDEGERLARLADERGRVLAVNQNGRWAPHFSFMRHGVEAGLIGKVSSVNFSLQWNHSWVAGTPFDDLRHLILMDFGVHWFDMCSVFFGDRLRTSVSAEVSRVPNQRTKAAMLAHVMVEYPDGQATMNFNGHVVHGQKDETIVTGELGTMRSTGPSLSEQRVSIFTEAGHAAPDLRGTWFDNGFQGAMTELLCAVDEKRTPCHGARNNLRTLELCFAALASAEDGGRPKIPGEHRVAVL